MPFRPHAASVGGTDEAKMDAHLNGRRCDSGVGTNNSISSALMLASGFEATARGGATCILDRCRLMEGTQSQPRPKGTLMATVGSDYRVI
jgi:hypothetical protein